MPVGSLRYKQAIDELYIAAMSGAVAEEITKRLYPNIDSQELCIMATMITANMCAPDYHVIGASVIGKSSVEITIASNVDENGASSVTSIKLKVTEAERS